MSDLHRILSALLLIVALHTAWPARALAADPPAPAPKSSRPDIPGEVIHRPTPRQAERRAVRALLAQRDAERAALEARLVLASDDARAALQMEIEQHKRATRLAVLDRQVAHARSRGDLALARRLEARRAQAAARVSTPLLLEVSR
jgi:hypothetical protein